VAIQETQMEQLSRILDAVEAHNAVQEAEKHAEARRQFLSQVLSKYVVPNAAYNDQGKRPWCRTGPLRFEYPCIHVCCSIHMPSR